MFMAEKKKLMCPECGSSNVRYVEKEGKVFCNECGEIFVKS
jgi:ribosomal protein S27E